MKYPSAFALLLLICHSQLALTGEHDLKKKLEDFSAYWATQPDCVSVSASMLATPPSDTSKTTPEARALHTRVLLSGGIVSWSGEQAWNIVMIEDIALHALVTDDAIDFMLCHELGHYSLGKTASKGQKQLNADEEERFADRYALQSCLRRYWGNPDLTSYKTRAQAAFLSGMAYYKEFLEHRSLTGDDPKAYRARKSAGLKAIKDQK